MEFSLNVKLDASEKLMERIERLTEALSGFSGKLEKREEPKTKEAVMAELKEAVETAKELDKQKEITEADIREAMQQVRDRIEVMDDKEEKAKYHRNLTSQFKLIAEEIAECKPSQIPTQEGRKRFIERIGTLEVQDGEVTEKCPF